MKVFEIVTPKSFTPQKLKTPVSDKYREMLKNTGHGRELVGSGSYANAYARENDPGSVDKVAMPISPVDRKGELIDGLDDDAYYKYLKLITKNERMSNNPYFPKIHDLKTFKGNDGRYTYNVNMERLQKLVSLSTEEAKMIGNNLFSNYMGVVKDTTRMLVPGGMMNKEDKKMVAKVTHQIYIQALSTCIGKAVEFDSEPATFIKDVKLKQALMLIRSLIKKNHPNIGNDTHVGNIMVRRGPFTPQLVLTDPVS